METISEQTAVKETLLELLGGQPESAVPGAVSGRRQASREKVQNLSVPDKRQEDWKYSDMDEVLSGFRFSVSSRASGFVVETAGQNAIHVHNGQVVKVELTEEARDQVSIIPIIGAMEQYPEWMEKYYGALLEKSEDFFSHLNMAYSDTGIFLLVKDGAQVASPIYMYQDCFDEQEMFVQSHNLVVVGRNASVTVVKKQVCSGDGARVFHNLASEVVLMEGARFSFHRLQNECKDTYQVTNLYASLEKDAHLHVTNIAIGGSFTRNNFTLALDAPGAEARLTGLTIINGTQHSDSWVDMRHNAPRCESDQLFKTIVNDSSMAAFSGKIYVARDAQQTNAYQSNKNIVLAAAANAYSKPQLEIYADDVKCSHGSTTGQIDEEALFYLRARGVKESSARKLLLYAFAENIVERLDDPQFREEVHELIYQKFNG